MEAITSRIGRGQVLLADGAIGSLLMARGLPRGAPPEGVNLEHPEILEEIARLYLEAGAEIIQTNTFGASPLKLANYGLGEQAGAINESAVRAVRRAVGERAYVSASCGPSGRILQPYGDMEAEKMFASFQLQMQALIQAGADIICVETMSDISEAQLAIQAARSVSPSIPVMATMTFEATARGFFTIMGVTIEKASSELQKAGADLIGSNCGNGSLQMVAIAKEFRKFTVLPLLIQANAGVPELRAGQVYYPETPEYMAEMCRELIGAGVAVIGGCCGTTPEHTRAMRKVVDEKKKNSRGS
ncbi:MAG: homocysteine S-methyltransferase family protein [Acidobacteria bacterium]|nr:homocysteine S-methyltransferase family protein [Acidobacteriota bacterium]MBU4307665.1 homocysteine S-methyltransferase family protein [Acidobacteriota bacterium]MBU4405401.1 homocysteine S-methyltransferase family protein [Acidobacteriota bacterium]MCG2809837.1 homocysteine S-methyltransferase family protein [Candidatus Aminicenantes bacterium]